MAESLSGKQLSAIQRTKRRPELQSLLFQKAKGLAWFDEFEKEGFLNPENHPRPVPAKQEGYVVVPLWPITEYLVTVSSELNVSGNERYAQLRAVLRRPFRRMPILVHMVSRTV